MAVDDVGSRSVQGSQNPQREGVTSKTSKKDREISKVWKTHSPGEDNPNVLPSLRKILSEKRAAKLEGKSDQGKENKLAIVVHSEPNTTAKVAQEAIKPSSPPTRPPKPTAPPLRPSERPQAPPTSRPDPSVVVTQFISDINTLARGRDAQVELFGRLTNEQREFIVKAISNPQDLKSSDVARLRECFNKMKEPPSLLSWAYSLVQPTSGPKVSPVDVRKAVMQGSIKSKLSELESALNKGSVLRDLFNAGKTKELTSMLRKASLQLHPDKASVKNRPEMTRIFTDVYNPVMEELDTYKSEF